MFFCINFIFPKMLIHPFIKSFNLMAQDDNFNNKNIFLDQQRLAIEHLQRHFQDAKKRFESTKTVAVQKSKPVLPALSIVQIKILKAIEEYEKEREEEARQRELERQQSREEEQTKDEKKITKERSGE